MRNTDFIIEFISNYYVLLIIIVVLILLALIGYESEKKKRENHNIISELPSGQNIEDIKNSLKSSGSISLNQAISDNSEDASKTEKPSEKSSGPNVEVL